MSHELTERERDARLDALLQAAEAERPESHPAPEELLAFHLGSLASEEREPLEEHLAGCPECAQVVLDFDIEKSLIASALERVGVARRFDFKLADVEHIRAGILAVLNGDLMRPIDRQQPNARIAGRGGRDRQRILA